MKPGSYRTVHAGDAGLGALLPPHVIAVEAIGEVEPDALFPEEMSLVAGAVLSRRLDVARGRSCARRALAALGISPVAIPSGADRAPIWPPGVVGSITHCHGYCCAAVARAERCTTIGIDAEVIRTLESGVERSILRETERERLDALDAAVPWSCVVFSIKEASYKAWYPVLRRWLEFHDVDVALDVPNGAFTARVLDAAPVVGRFQIANDRVLSVATLE
ncbi:MAG TPA: 4'-phosphopantetheinyl transferase superfamily protein [Kofleriaceae bacterium]|jgi:4'-phosphopantetheinyl transferase EntD|nr:4'-phosphopantetheinyl transferase superfamily protein [Kofleriaceae bacterium]